MTYKQKEINQDKYCANREKYRHGIENSEPKNFKYKKSDLNNQGTLRKREQKNIKTRGLGETVQQTLSSECDTAMTILLHGSNFYAK